MTTRQILGAMLPTTALAAATMLAGASQAVAQDYRARDDAAPLMTAGLLERKPSAPPEMFTRYWRDVHGPLAARIHGFYQYWQHHLGAPQADFWPVSGVEQSVPEAYRIQGFAETTFRAAADREKLGQDPAAQALFYDEQNVFRATYLFPSAPGDSHTYLDRFENGAPQGPQRVPTYIVLVQRADGASQDALASYLRDRLGPALAGSPDLMKVRLHLLQPFDPKAWDTPGVAHDLPPRAQYQAILEVAFRDATAERQFLGSPAFRQAASELPHVIRALHTYPVTATYTAVYDGRPTLVGLKGMSVAETILATGARNQVSADVLRLLNGPDVQPPSALVFPGRDAPAPSQASAR